MGLYCHETVLIYARYTPVITGDSALLAGSAFVVQGYIPSGGAYLAGAATINAIYEPTPTQGVLGGGIAFYESGILPTGGAYGAGDALDFLTIENLWCNGVAGVTNNWYSNVPSGGATIGGRAIYQEPEWRYLNSNSNASSVINHPTIETLSVDVVEGDLLIVMVAYAHNDVGSFLLGPTSQLTYNNEVKFNGVSMNLDSYGGLFISQDPYNYVFIDDLAYGIYGVNVLYPFGAIYSLPIDATMTANVTVRTFFYTTTHTGSVRYRTVTASAVQGLTNRAVIARSGGAYNSEANGPRFFSKDDLLTSEAANPHPHTNASSDNTIYAQALLPISLFNPGVVFGVRASSRPLSNWTTELYVGTNVAPNANLVGVSNEGVVQYRDVTMQSFHYLGPENTAPAEGGFVQLTLDRFYPVTTTYDFFAASMMVVYD